MLKISVKNIMLDLNYGTVHISCEKKTALASRPDFLYLMHRFAGKSWNKGVVNLMTKSSSSAKNNSGKKEARASSARHHLRSSRQQTFAEFSGEALYRYSNRVPCPLTR